MEFSHEGGKLRRHGIGMKFSDYLNAEPSPKKVTQTFNVRDENRESILEKKLAQASSELASLEDQTTELQSLQKSTSNLTRERSELVIELTNTKIKLEEVSSQVDNEANLRQSIKSLERQVITHEEHFAELTEKSDKDVSLISKREREILEVTADKLMLETYQRELKANLQFAEQKKEDSIGELKYIKNKFFEVDESAKELMNNYTEAQKDLSLGIDQRRALRNKIQILESELESTRNLSASLNDSVNSVQEFYAASQNRLHFSEDKSSKLDDTVNTLVRTVTSLEQENSYLVDKQKMLEIALAKPKYVSQNSIAKREGFKIPLASAALNIQKNYLGTGQPTLLKFRNKESTNDNT
jgi:chromosome segregation ATPase